MKKARLLIALLCAALGVGMLTFAACKPEETSLTQTATLTLSAGEGGTLAQTTYEVEVGTTLSDYLKNIAPTPEEGLTFAGWYHADDLLTTEQMPEGGYTLTAKYNASYTVNVYLESVDGTYGEPKSVTDSSIYGEAFSYSPTEEHFVLDEDRENRLSAEKLGKGETFTAYMKRETYAINYYSNAPEGETVEGSIPSAAVRYGATYSLPGGEGFTAEAWLRFAGWATEANGPVVYAAGEEISPEDNLFLHAVWDRACFDRFGGGDFIFFPQTEAGVALLLRADKEYRGEVLGNSTAEETLFSFKENGREVLKGKASKATGTFVYYREAQDGVTYRHANAYDDTIHEDGATIAFDGYGNITYTAGEEVLTGEVTYDPETMYYTFAAGERAFDFLLTELVGDETETVFVTVGAEAGLYADYSFYYDNGEIKPVSDLYTYLNGLGVAIVIGEDALIVEGDMVYLDANAEVYYAGSYLPQEGGVVFLSLIDADGETYETSIKLLTYLGVPIHVNEDGWAGTYTAADGSKLVLDGFSGTNESAVYTDAEGTVKKGMYAFDFTRLDGMLLRFREESGGITTFRIDKEAHSLSLLGDGDYKEYFIYYGNSVGGALGSATLVFGENNSATLYVDGEEEATGTVTAVQGSDGLFLFTSSDSDLVFEYRPDEGDFRIGGFRYHCYFFTYYPIYNEENEAMMLLPTDDGGALLVDAQGEVAVYTKGNSSSVGFFYNLSDIGVDFGEHTYLEFLEIETDERKFFEIVEEEDAALAVLLGEASGYYDLYADGSVNEDSFLLLLFGEDNVAVYVDAEGSDRLGTFTYDTSTDYGTLTLETNTDHSELRFVLRYVGGTYCFALHNGLWEGDEKTFLGESGNSLELNAYGQGFYNGVAIEYLLLAASKDENTRRIYVLGYTDTSYFDGYFDINIKDGTYTACGYEVGQYYEAEKREDVLYFDGYGKVTRHNIHETEADGETLKTLETGAYTVLDLDEGIILIQMGGKSYTVHVYGLADAEGDVVYYYTQEFEGAGTYYGENWEVVTLSPYGEAVFTDRYGVSYEGEYTLLSEHGVSFVSDSLDGTQIFLLGQNNSFTHPTSGLVIDGDVLVKYLGGSEKAITVPAGVKTVAPLAFSEHEYGSRYRGADITSIDLNEVVEVGENAFNGCTELKSVKGAHVKTVGENAFYACIELASLDLPLLEEIGENAFHLCESLTTVSLESAKTVYSSAFSGCYELVRVELPAAEELYEGVFYDCFALETVVLGANLTQLGTPDEPVAGVFERSYAPAQQPLTVVLQGTTPPTVGYNLFMGVATYTLFVQDVQTVKAFYQNEGWEAYNANLGCASEYDGTYARVVSGIFAVLNLNGIATYDSKFDSKILGAYEVGEDKMLIIYTFDPEAENKYTTAVRGEFYDGGIKFDADNYGLEYKDYTWEQYYGPDKEYTLNEYNDSGETLSFKLAGDLSAIPATFVNSNGAALEVTLVFARDGDGIMVLYFDVERTRYELYLYANPAAWFEYTKSFIPIVTAYEAADGSVLILSQEDEEGTKFTAHSILAGMPNIKEFRLENIVPVWTDENTFTYDCERDDVSYHFTFVLGDGTFSYTYTADNMTTLTSEDGNMRLVVTQNADGGIVRLLLSEYVYPYGPDFPEYAEWAVYSDNFIANTDGGYYYYVYGSEYYARYKITLTLEGKTVTGFTAVESGKALQAYLAGIYAVVYLDESGAYNDYALYVREGSAFTLFAHTTGGAVSENLLTVVIESGTYANTYYITFNTSNESAKLVIKTTVYQGAAWEAGGELEGTVTVVRNPSGDEESITLSVAGKNLTTYSKQGADYLFEDGEKYYLVSLASTSCTIYELTQREFKHEGTQFSLSVLVKKNNDVAVYLKAYLNGQEVKYSKQQKTINGEDYILITIASSNTEYAIHVADGVVGFISEVTVASADETYRITMQVSDAGLIVSVSKFEIKEDGVYAEKKIGWFGYMNGDGYNYEIDIGNDYYYFNIEKVGNDWKVTFVKVDIWS